MKPFRKEKIANEIRRIVADAVARRLSDPRIAPMTTVSRVEVTGDLLIAKVYLAVPTGDADERKTLAAMQSARGFLQRLVARQLALRQCPELRIAMDDQLRRVQETLNIIEANRRERGDDEVDVTASEDSHEQASAT